MASARRRSEKGVGGSITLEVGTVLKIVGGRRSGGRRMSGTSSSRFRFFVYTSSSGATDILCRRECYLSVVVGGARVGAAI